MPFRIEDAKIKVVTEKAVMVEAPIFDEPQWVPQSQIHPDSEIWKEEQEGDLVVTDWFARKKGWSDE